MLTKENYFENESSKKYMSVSLFKDIDLDSGGCEKKAHAKLYKGYQEDSKGVFLQGHYLHSWNEGKEALEEFILRNPQMISSRGATKGQLKAEFKGINDTIEFLEQDKGFMRALEGKKETIFTGELFGIPWKIMVDSLNENYFTDLKFMKSLRDRIYSKYFETYVNFVLAYRYDIQGAVYQQIVKQNVGKELEFYIAAVDKSALSKSGTKVPDKELISFTKEDFQNALAYVESKIERVKLVWKNEISETELVGCGTCEYCKSKKLIKKPVHWSEL